MEAMEEILKECLLHKIYFVGTLKEIKNSLDYNDSKGWNLLDNSIKDKKEFLGKVWNSDRALAFSFEANKCAACGNGCQVYNV